MAPRPPLDGIRIVEMSTGIAVPGATRMLGELGAEVITVESLEHAMPMVRTTLGNIIRPPKEFIASMGPMLGSWADGDPGERPWNRLGYAAHQLMNKRSCTMDVGRPEGVELFTRLVGLSDVVIENMAPGAMDRLGIGYETLRAVKPDLIYVSVPLGGVSGPRRDYRGYGMATEALGGGGWLHGYGDLNPMEKGSAPGYADAYGGISATFAVLAALHHRRLTGEGQLVDWAQPESYSYLFTEAVMDHVLTGRVQYARGNRDPGVVQGVYPCAGDEDRRLAGFGRWVAITIADDDDWEGLCRVMGTPHLVADERFADGLRRREHHDELDGVISSWTSRHDDEAVALLLHAEGIAAMPVLSSKRYFEDPHLRDRGFFVEHDHPDAGRRTYLGTHARYRNRPLASTAPVRLGEDNEYVYKALLGIDDDGYARLEKDGHVGMDFVPGHP